VVVERERPLPEADQVPNLSHFRSVVSINRVIATCSLKTVTFKFLHSPRLQFRKNGKFSTELRTELLSNFTFVEAYSTTRLVLSRFPQDASQLTRNKFYLTIGHERSLTQIKFNAEGDLLFSCSKDHVINVWYSHNGERLGTYEGNNGTVWTVDVDCAFYRPSLSQ
jgi:WD40 repeat protein